jgi:uncharacterized membrane protein YdfJ with MMPL/SSD domain
VTKVHTCLVIAALILGSTSLASLAQNSGSVNVDVPQDIPSMDALVGKQLGELYLKATQCQLKTAVLTQQVKKGQEDLEAMKKLADALRVKCGKPCEEPKVEPKK